MTRNAVELARRLADVDRRLSAVERVAQADFRSWEDEDGNTVSLVDAVQAGLDASVQVSGSASAAAAAVADAAVAQDAADEANAAGAAAAIAAQDANAQAAVALAAGQAAATAAQQAHDLASNIGPTQITDDAIQTRHILAGAITADEILAGAITAGKLAADSVLASNITADAVTARAIKAGEVVAGKLAADSVLATNIKAGEVKAGHLAANAVTAATVAAGAIDGLTITGATIRSAASGMRVQVSSSTSGDFLQFFTGDAQEQRNGGLRLQNMGTGQYLTFLESPIVWPNSLFSSDSLYKASLILGNVPPTGGTTSATLAADSVFIGHDFGGNSPSTATADTISLAAKVVNVGLPKTVGASSTLNVNGSPVPTMAGSASRKIQANASSVTTTAAGLANIPHSLGVAPQAVVGTYQGSTSRFVTVVNAGTTATNLQFQVVNDAGTPIASTAVVIQWIAIG